MTWVEVFLVLLVSHLAGDFLLQTEWQAENKRGGLGRDPVARRALREHVALYLAAFLPALIWIGSEQGVGSAIVAALIVGLTHWILDDGRLLEVWIGTVKRARTAPIGLRIAVDQSFHVVFLFAAALIVAA